MTADGPSLIAVGANESDAINVAASNILTDAERDAQNKANPGMTTVNVKLSMDGGSRVATQSTGGDAGIGCLNCKEQLDTCKASSQTTEAKMNKEIDH